MIYFFEKTNTKENKRKIIKIKNRLGTKNQK